MRELSGEISLLRRPQKNAPQIFPLNASIRRNVIAQVWYEGRKVEDTRENVEGLGRIDVES